MIKHARSTLIPLGLYWASMMVTLLLFVLLSRAAVAFQCVSPRQRLAAGRRHIISSELALASKDASDDVKVTVKAADLDDSLGLTKDERTVVNVHRSCSPSVVYVTSVLESADSSNGGRRSRRWQRSKSKAESEEGETDGNGKRKLPRGTALGSGSGFVVDSNGYIVTNYHVIQRAYEANQVIQRYNTFWDNLARNATTKAKDSLKPIGVESEMLEGIEGLINGTINAISGSSASDDSPSPPAEVFVRFGENGDGDAMSSRSSSASYHPCEIVDVVKELDVAVLKMSNPPPSMKALSYGSSSDLLVGQSLVAIGNPFGLDRTITSGLVSALGRSITGVAGNDIKNCIQTDASINPGNSGGPLLNLKGEVVGVNTMIITTSGSSAGIGFAVPGDNVKESADKIVELDKERQAKKLGRKGRGWLGIDVATSSLEASLNQRLSVNSAGAFITSIAADSPLLQNQDESGVGATIKTTNMKGGNIHLGSRIINVGGSVIANGQEFVTEMKKRVEGEQLSLTVEDANGEKKVVYVVLGNVPL